MKTTMKWLGIFTIITFIFSACGKDDDDDISVSCNCNPKEHYLPCDCKENNCSCKIIPRGYLTDTEYPNISIPFYQGVGVPDNGLYSTVGDPPKMRIILWWEIISKTQKDFVVENVSRIELVVPSENSSEVILDSRVLRIWHTLPAGSIESNIYKLINE